MLCKSYLRHQLRSIIVGLLCLISTAAAYGSDTYNAATGQLTIPSVTIGSATYFNMVVAVGGVVSIGSAPANGSQDSYNPTTNQLTIPTVMVGTTPYYNVVATVGSLISIGSVTGANTYNGTNLTIPSVLVGSTTYNNAVITVGSVIGVAGGIPNPTFPLLFWLLSDVIHWFVEAFGLLRPA
jgi:hypothetical protein